MITSPDFDGWNNEKKDIHLEGDKIFFIQSREIWFVKLGINIGFEQNGKKEFRRPVLVIKKVGSLFFILPLTTAEKKNTKYYHTISTGKFHEHNQVKNSVAILSQAKVIDKRRFLHKIGEIAQQEFIEIKKELKELLL